jgi:tRNA-2-methylthio-N6-dimethylallyladenosine synthase
VNSYHDPLGRRTFAELLAAVGQVAGIRRVRFMTSHPRHFTREIVEAIDSVPTLCDHVHLPVQSGSSRVLAAMNREYTREQYLERIAWLRATRHRQLSLTTDFIVGFPGETEAEFEESVTLCEEVQFDGIFSFKYSPRPNTPALAMENAIPEEEKSRRLTHLNELQREIQRSNWARHVGTVMEVMVESHAEERLQIPARSSQNKTVNFTLPPGAAVPAVGSYVQVLITRAHPNSLVGEMVASASGRSGNAAYPPPVTA